jgi:hypothetical protein
MRHARVIFCHGRKHRLRKANESSSTYQREPERGTALLLVACAALIIASGWATTVARSQANLRKARSQACTCIDRVDSSDPSAWYRSDCTDVLSGLRASGAQACSTSSSDWMVEERPRVKRTFTSNSALICSSCVLPSSERSPILVE